MAHDVTFAVAGRLDARTGGSVYNRRVAEALGDQGWSVSVRELPGEYPRPGPGAIDAAARVFAELPAGRVVVVDGLAASALPDLLEREATRLRIVALVHLPIAADVGLDEATVALFRQWESRALAAASLVVVTGAATLALLEPYSLVPQRLVVVEPGTDPAPIARPAADGPVQLLSVATLNPGKGHEILLQALARVASSAWRLTCAGNTTRHPATTSRVEALAGALGLEDRVHLTGELDTDALDRAYASAHVFVLATWQETYGMAVAEALARGLPVVCTTTGAIPSLVGDEAGLLVKPGDVDALAGALTRVIGDARLRNQLAAGAARVRQRLPSWTQAARRFGAALEGLTT